MDCEIDRSQAISGSSLAKCRNPQFTLHFRAELAQFNVPGTGLPNPVAVKFKCKHSLRKKPTNTKLSFSSIWKIRHPEMQPNGRIAVPIFYEGDWSRATVVSLVFIVHSKKTQRVAYSKGEIVLIDDVCDERFSILMTPRSELSSDDLKAPVIVHLLMDVWDVDAGKKRIRCARESQVHEIPRIIRDIGQGLNRLSFERVECVCTSSDECVWPESTDFLIEIPSSTAQAVPCKCNGECKVDENANLLLPSDVGQPCVQFFCHQSVLSKESVAFSDMFKSHFTKDANVLRVRSVSVPAVEMFLNYLYYGQLSSMGQEDGDARVEFEEIIEVVQLANRYEVDRLRLYCDTLLTDRYLNLYRAADAIMLAERYELPILGQAAMSILSLSFDEEYLRELIGDGAKHLLTTVISEARKKHMFCAVINPC